MQTRIHPEAVSPETELKRLREWIEVRSEAVFDHMAGNRTLDGIAASVLANQVSEARKAECQLTLVKLCEPQSE